MEISIEEKKSGSYEAKDKEKWVYDSSVDHRGRIPLRKSTGAWKASLFIIAIEFSERLCYYGIATSLITYLIKVLHLDLKTAAKNVNYWVGVTTLVPLLGGFAADGYTGRFKAILVSSVIYILGLCLLTMSQYVPALKPCNSCRSGVHEAVFFVAIYLISVGTGGHKPSLESFGADQFDENHEEERKKKMSFFNWWNFGLCCGTMLGVTVIVYVQEFVSWGAADIILTSVMTISLIVFLIGKPFYRYQVPKGSPLTPMVQVLVAAIAKRNIDHPQSPAQLYEVPISERRNMRLLSHTSKLRFLDKAAIIVENGANRGPAGKQSKWRLATVTQVEETKLIFNMVPIWLAMLVFGITIAQASTFFIKQGSKMNRKLTHNFTIPQASVFVFPTLSMIITICIYDKILVPILRRTNNNERGISILQRIGVGLTFSVAAMVSAAMVEKKRLSSSREEHIISVFWLAPQFLILGIGDGFALVGLQEYFYDQVPDRMRSLGISFYLSVIGASSFLSSLLITVVDHVTEKLGNSWFAQDLNKSRLDYFYWLLAVMSAINLCGYVFLATKYSYKSIENSRVDGDDFVKVDNGLRTALRHG